MSEAEARVSTRRKIPAIWIVPVVAFVLGIWMVIYTAINEGPEIVIKFSTAEGIEAGKTKLKSRSVAIGLVESVTLNEDLESVSVVARLDPSAAPLLHDDSRFWVVRPRIGAGGISGLGTLMSGAYIELEPGSGEPSDRREFEGLEEIPVTAVGTPGVRITLVADRAGSVGTGDPVLYRGFQVGRIEKTVFDASTRQVRHRVFIDSPYDQLVNSATRFWNASGISLSASADGVKLEVGSLQSLLAGGVAFGLPSDLHPQVPVKQGAEFKLYDSYESTLEEKFRVSVDYVVSFAQSIRGLTLGAPVEYRGVPIGEVREIMLAELARIGTRGSGAPIPVRIRIEPGRMKLGDNEAGLNGLRQAIDVGVGRGLRASLQTGNLLTGVLFISLDFYRDEGAAQIGTFAGYPTIPTLAGGLERIERQVSRLLRKLNDMPLETTVAELNATLAEVRRIVASQSTQELPQSLNASLQELRQVLGSLNPDSPLYDRLDRTLTELNRTLQSVGATSRTVGDQPSSILFSTPTQPDPEPRGAQ